MQRQVTMADPMAEAHERIDTVSFLNEVRGTAEFNRQLVLDGLSGIMAHEDSALRMYRQYSQETDDPSYREHWQEFAEETNVHKHVAERVILALGGDPSYRSTLASEVEKAARVMLSIDAKGPMADLVRLGYLVMAENICRHHWKGINNLARRIKDPDVAKILSDASSITERDEQEHVRWNTVAYDSQFEKVMTGS
mgnify:CR=1 FL=1